MKCYLSIVLILLGATERTKAMSRPKSFMPGPRSPLEIPRSRRLSNTFDICTMETCGFDGSTFERAAQLQASLSSTDPEINIYWTIDETRETIQIGVEATNVNGWFSLGLSANGGMMGADLWTLREDGGTLKLTDMFVEDWRTPREDATQNLHLRSSMQTTDGKVAFSFERKLKTCDGGGESVVQDPTTAEDFDIRTHVVSNLIFAWGESHVFEYHGRSNRGYFVGFHWGNSGRNIEDSLVEEEGRQGGVSGIDGSGGGNYPTWDDQVVVEYINEPYTIDHTRDTILVHTHFTPPSDGNWVIARIEQISDSSVQRFHHHMLFYGCTETPTTSNVSSEARGEGFCNEILAVTPGFGLAVGGQSSVLGFRVEVHYDGLTPLTSNLVDPGAGYRITYIPDDGRVEEMGVLITGTLALQIDGELERTDERAHFWGTCTIPDSVGPEGVNVMYNFWHMHLRGRGMYTSHIRNGVELEPLGRQNYYDWWYQGTGGAPPVGRKLLPGDTLIAHCYYDTRNRQSTHDRGSSTITGPGQTTTFGEGTNDEMCFNFIAYYPRHPDLKNCFNGMGQGPVSDVFDRRRLQSGRVPPAAIETQDKAVLRALQSGSAFVKHLASEILKSKMDSIRVQGDERALVSKRRRMSSCDGSDPACFDPQDACFSALRDQCAPDPNGGPSAQSCYAYAGFCTSDGTISPLVHIVSGGACVTAFSYCGPCYPHHPCGGDFIFSLTEVNSFTMWTPETRSSSCGTEQSMLSPSSDNSSPSTTVIAGAIAGVIIVAVLAAVGYVTFLKPKRPTTPKKSSIVPSAEVHVVKTEAIESH